MIEYNFIACNNPTNKQLHQWQISQWKLIWRSLELINSTPNLTVYSNAGEYDLGKGYSQLNIKLKMDQK